MGLFDMVGVRRHSTATVYAAAHRRGGDNHDALFGCVGNIQGIVHPQLDMEILRDTKLFRSHRGGGRHRSNDPVFGFLLGLLHKVSYNGV